MRRIDTCMRSFELSIFYGQHRVVVGVIAARCISIGETRFARTLILLKFCDAARFSTGYHPISWLNSWLLRYKFRERANRLLLDKLFFSLTRINYFVHNMHNHSFSTVYKRSPDCMTRTGTASFRGKNFDTELLTFRRNLFLLKLAKYITSCCNETRKEFNCVNLTESMEKIWRLNKVRRKEGRRRIGIKNIR